MRGSDPEKSETVAVYNSPSEDDHDDGDDGDNHGGDDDDKDDNDSVSTGNGSDDDNDDNDNVSTGNGVLPGWFRPRIGRRRLSTREWGAIIVIFVIVAVINIL